MKLFDSFKWIVEKRGGDIVRHKAFLNLLNDMNAFENEDKVVFKKIMREMYKDDLPEKIVGVGKWNGICQQLISNFVKTTGCQQHIVEYIVKCFLYSVDKISEKDMLKAYNDFINSESKTANGKNPKNEQKPRPNPSQNNGNNPKPVKPQPTPTTSTPPIPPIPPIPPTPPTLPNLPQQSWLRKNAAWFIPCIILLLLAVVVASQMTSNSKTEKNVKAKETEMLASDTVFNLTREDLVGNYSVKIESNGQLKRLTGYIDYDAIGQCTLHVLSDYEPMLFILNVNGKGMISNDDLGTTYMIHQKSINKRTITFTKNNTVCTLTR